MIRSARQHAAREFARPLPVAAAALLALNDHVLKGSGVLPGWLTGKLSDVAGMFFFPVLLFALASALLGTPSGKARVLRAAALAGVTAVVFAAVKALPAANALANAVLGRVVLDPSDLLACPFALASVLYLRRAPGPLAPVPTTLKDRVLLVLAAIASMATSTPHNPGRGYPTWRVDEPRVEAGCTKLFADVVTSGKEGMGVVLVLLRESPRCDVRVERALVRIGSVTQEAIAVGAWDAKQTIYLGFLFDNERLWNDGIRIGALELDVVSGNRRRHVVYTMFHAWAGWHPSSPLPPAPLPAAAPAMPLAVPPAFTEAP